MEYVRFGNTGLMVSRLALGCMDFAVRLDRTDAATVIDAALEHGVNLLDTADAYGNGPGEGEEALGQLIKGKRDHLLLATKFWAPMEKGPNRGGCSRYHIFRAVDDSLRRLGTDHIDLYQLHQPAKNTPVEEILSTLDTLVKAGKVRYIGVCNHYAWQMAHMLGVSAVHNWEPITSIQCRYNLLDRQVENETVPFVERFHMGMIVYGPLDGGILTGKYRRGEPPPKGSRVDRVGGYQRRLTDDVFDILESLEGMAQTYGITLPQLAMAWVCSKPYVTTILMGGSRVEHFQPLYAVPDLTIDPADLARIDQMSEHHRYKPFWNQSGRLGPPLAQNRW